MHCDFLDALWRLWAVGPLVCGARTTVPGAELHAEVVSHGPHTPGSSGCRPMSTQRAPESEYCMAGFHAAVAGTPFSNSLMHMAQHMMILTSV